MKDAIAAGQVDLHSTATTLALLKLDAVVGVKGEVRTIDGRDTLVRVGITCALCYSKVDDSFAPGIGSRLDGWANTGLNPGAIIALSPALTEAQRAVYASWGTGRYDPRFSIDGLSTPLVLPPAYGLDGGDRETFTAEGPVSYWNAYVAVTQMHGQGDFSDPRLGIDVRQSPDLVTSKLVPLAAYQRSLRTPRPPGVVQIQAGGLGVDLTRAGFVIYFSKGFSLGDYEQSLARAHRPGQTRPVLVIHLESKGTVDEKVARALAERKDVVEAVLGMIKKGGRS